MVLAILKIIFMIEFLWLKYFFVFLDNTVLLAQNSYGSNYFAYKKKETHNEKTHPLDHVRSALHCRHALCSRDS